MVRGVVVLFRAGREIDRWPLEIPGDDIDVGAVDLIARLQLLARAAGGELRFARLCPRVRELLDLAGLAEWVEMER